MSNPSDGGGAFLLSRQLFDHPIWHMPPYYSKLWIYIIGRCNHTTVVKHGITFNRGECLITLRELQENTMYKSGFRTEKISKKQAWSFCGFLRENHMVETRKTTRGIFVKILQYEEWQDLRNYESNNGGNNEATTRKQAGNTINKNENNEKNENNGKGREETSLTPSQKMKKMIELSSEYESRQKLITALNKNHQFDIPTLKEELPKFIDHWTEPSKNGKQERWQMQKTFDPIRRLRTWINNSYKWSK